MSRPYFTDAEWEELLKKIKPQTLAKEQIVNAAVEMMKGGYKSNQQVTANHTAKMFNHSRTQHLAWGGNPATLKIVLPKDYILIDDYPIHAGYQHNKDGYVWMYNGNGWVRQEKIKMTKKEAIEKALTVTCGVSTHDIINVLEVLELIKFDDEDKTMGEAIAQARSRAMDTPEFIKKLSGFGYKIVKK